MADTDTVNDYAEKTFRLSIKSSHIRRNNGRVEDGKSFFKGLPRTKFIHIVALLEQVLDLNSTGFEDIVGRLKAFEEYIKEETQDEDQSKLMFVRNDT